MLSLTLLSLPQYWVCSCLMLSHKQGNGLRFSRILEVSVPRFQSVLYRHSVDIPCQCIGRYTIFVQNAFHTSYCPRWCVKVHERHKCGETGIVISALYREGGGGSVEHDDRKRQLTWRWSEIKGKTIAYLWINVSLNLQNMYHWNI